MEKFRWRSCCCAALAVVALIFPVGLAARTAIPSRASFSSASQKIRTDAAVVQNVPQGGQASAQAASIAPPESGWLGISITEVTQDRVWQAKLPRAQGILVTQVKPDGPGAKAGLQPNDVILDYNGRAVEGVLQFRRLVRETPPGRTVSLRVWRDGRRHTLSTRVDNSGPLLESGGEDSDSRAAGNRPRQFVVMQPLVTEPILGIHAQDITGQLAQYFQAPDGRGVLVVDVSTGSAADKGGVKAGDVIYQVEGQPVHTSVELGRELLDNCAAGNASLGVVRKGLNLEMNVQFSCSRSAGSNGGATL